MLAASLSAHAGRARSMGCTPGATRVAGKKATRFCGPATVAVHAGKHWFRLTGGSCAAASSFFTVNIGTVVVAPNQKVPYFGLTLGRYPGAPKGSKVVGGDGVYHKGVLVTRWHGGAWDIQGYVRTTLWSHETGGSFTGRTSFFPHTTISGTFKC